MIRASALLLTGLFLAAGCPSATTKNGQSQSGKVAVGESSRPLESVGNLEIQRADAKVIAGFLDGAEPALVRARAALALARLEHMDTLPFLLEAVDDPHAQVRKNAAFGLGQMDLAFEEGHPPHEAFRGEVERKLVARLGGEPDRGARQALIRALGRVAKGVGLERLVEESQSGAQRVSALFALGVSGARRSSSLRNHAGLAQAVGKALDDSDPRLRRAAAYAAFRQKLALDTGRFTAIVAEPDAQTRIHLARLLGVHMTDPAQAHALLKNSDWRVQVEAYRALAALQARGGKVPLGPIRDGLFRAVRAAIPGGGAKVGQVHVAAEACTALWPVGSKNPLGVEDVQTTVDQAIEMMGESVALNDLRCTCAAAADATTGGHERVDACWKGEEAAVFARIFRVEVATRSRISSREQVVLLTTFLNDEDFRVRSAAAYALAESPSRAGFALAVERLASEKDPGVADALLSALDNAPAEVFAGDILGQLADRFSASDDPDALEVLVHIGRALARTPDSSAHEVALATLREHEHLAIRDAAFSKRAGERHLGARTRVDLPVLGRDLPRVARVRTTRGAFKIRFFNEETPATVANFTTLAKKGFFDGVRFHRVIPDFVAQGGDPRGDGFGGPGHRIPCENSDLPYLRGSVGMALAGKDTGGSQFFVTHSDQPHLDGRYTLFGKVEEGMDVVDNLSATDAILSVTVEGD
jgi:cyclophilin family peptidyl-prolyl cis-trans isomerase/HEAT repeat protein